MLQNASRFLGLLILSSIFLGLQGCLNLPWNTLSKSDSLSVIRVGEVGSMTGAEAAYGLSTHRGIELAIGEINLAGGVSGKRIELISLDDKGNDSETQFVSQQLIDHFKVVAVLGEVATPRSEIMAVLFQKNRIPMMSPSSTGMKVTQLGDYIFRSCFVDSFQGQALGQFAREHLKLKTIAILRKSNNDYAAGLSVFFSNAFVKGGGKISSILEYQEPDGSYQAQLKSIQAKKPDAIFIPGYYREVAKIAIQARKLGIRTPLLGGDGWGSEQLLRESGSALQGSYFSSHFSKELPSQKVKDFVIKFKNKYGMDPDSFAVNGYDAARLLADRMRRAKSLSGEAIKESLSTTHVFEGVTGKIAINSHRNAEKPVVIQEVKDGAYHYLTSVMPQMPHHHSHLRGRP